MNLSKFLIYLLSGNVAEVLVLMVGLAFKNEDGISVYPISPVAALWVSPGICNRLGALLIHGLNTDQHHCRWTSSSRPGY